MTALQRRFKSVIQRLGDSYIGTHGAGFALTGILSVGQAKLYLDDTTAAALNRPIRAFYVSHDDPAVVADSITWAGLTLAVKKIIELRFQSAVIAKMLVVA